MKTSSALTVFIFILVILPLTVGFLVKPADTYSPEEQRDLQQFPSVTVETFFNGSFSSAVNTYMNDQFPLRDTFVSIKSVVETALMKRENNGVLKGENGQLAVRLFAATDGALHDESLPKTDLFYENVVENAASVVETLHNHFEDCGIPFAVLLPPRTIDVAASAFAYPDTNSTALVNCVNSSFAAAGNIEIASFFRSRYDAGEYIYYRTDHHWTSLGAYYAYANVMSAFGEGYYNITAFDRITVSDSFLGTTYSKSGYKGITPDSMEIFVLPTLPPSSFVTTRPYEKAVASIDGLYYEPALAESNKYPYYLGGTTKYLTVKQSDGTEREKLMILGDSFALSLIPFLALHYDIEFVRLNNWRDVFGDYGAPDCDRVLVVWNYENIITTTNLSRISGIAAYYGDAQ